MGGGNVRSKRQLVTYLQEVVAYLEGLQCWVVT